MKIVAFTSALHFTIILLLRLQLLLYNNNMELYMKVAVLKSTLHWFQKKKKKGALHYYSSPRILTLKLFRKSLNYSQT